MDISIIIPTYNRSDKLKKCLDSALSQDYPHDKFEVIVVDDGSSDETLEVLCSLAKEHGMLRYFSQPHQGPAAARNLGIKESRAGILGFTDNDCVLEPDWARRMVDVHRSHPHSVAVGGSTQVDIHRSMAAVSQHLSDGAIETSIDGKQEVIFFSYLQCFHQKGISRGGF
jgi:Glycosyltransferases involved in cell wall biogenesis